MRTASRNGIFSKLDTPGVAEALEKFQLVTAHRGENLVNYHTINNTVATFFCCGISAPLSEMAVMIRAGLT
jgi:UDP-N-acetylglucosamine 2-epimerase